MERFLQKQALISKIFYLISVMTNFFILSSCANPPASQGTNTETAGIPPWVPVKTVTVNCVCGSNAFCNTLCSDIYCCYRYTLWCEPGKNCE